MKVKRTRRGTRFVHGDAVVSEALASPGPTQSVFDVLAACVAALAPGPRVVLLGFASGAMLAPLRAMGWRHPVEAVDLSRAGEKFFRRISGSWAGAVKVFKAEASDWLTRRPGRYDAIVEDLSVQDRPVVLKPSVSIERLPDLIAKRLAPAGVAVINLLPVPGMRWREVFARMSGPHAETLLISFRDFDNRVLIGAQRLPEARQVSRRIRSALRSIGSRQDSRISVRRMRRHDSAGDFARVAGRD